MATEKKLGTLFDLCVSSLRRGHANLLCIVPILSDDPRRESSASKKNTKKVTCFLCQEKGLFELMDQQEILFCLVNDICLEKGVTVGQISGRSRCCRFFWGFWQVLFP